MNNLEIYKKTLKDNLSHLSEKEFLKLKLSFLLPLFKAFHEKNENKIDNEATVFTEFSKSFDTKEKLLNCVNKSRETWIEIFVESIVFEAQLDEIKEKNKNNCFSEAFASYQNKIISCAR